MFNKLHQEIQQEVLTNLNIKMTSKINNLNQYNKIKEKKNFLRKIYKIRMVLLIYFNKQDHNL